MREGMHEQLVRETDATLHTDSTGGGKADLPDDPNLAIDREDWFRRRKSSRKQFLGGGTLAVLGLGTKLVPWNEIPGAVERLFDPDKRNRDIQESELRRQLLQGDINYLHASVIISPEIARYKLPSLGEAYRGVDPKLHYADTDLVIQYPVLVENDGITWLLGKGDSGAEYVPLTGHEESLFLANCDETPLSETGPERVRVTSAKAKVTGGDHPSFRLWARVGPGEAAELGDISIYEYSADC
jgi:hypothetical protein